MSEMTPPQGADNGAQQTAPRLSVASQYVKDLSFENPRAPQGLGQGAPRPEIQVGVDVKAQQIGEGQYEIVLEVKLDAKAGQTAMFLLELAYGGVFSLANIPQDSLQPLLLIECPRLLFPFARRIVADVTRDGGLPPLMLDPIDFVALYRHRLAQAQQQAGVAGTA
jgi:preprotein translocase subunit SecB